MTRPSFLLILLISVGPAAGPAAVPAAAQAISGGARTVALAGATTALEGAPWGWANPAGAAGVEGPVLAIFGSQAYALEELRYGSILYAHPFRFATVSLQASAYGFSAYRQMDVQVGFGRSFSPGTSRSIHGGVALRYRHLALADPYGSDGHFSLSFGWIVRLIPSLAAGFSAGSLVSVSYHGEKLPRSMRLGLSYRASDGITVLLDTRKAPQRELTVGAGLELQPISFLLLRAGVMGGAGVSSAPTAVSGGVGLHVGAIRTGFAAQHHAALGWSPALSFGMAW